MATYRRSADYALALPRLRQNEIPPMTTQRHEAAELLPCPFCGQKAIIKIGHKEIAFVLCERCKAITSFGGQEGFQNTCRAWNQRASASPMS